MSPVRRPTRAGIVVTGTEVLTGRDQRPQRALDLGAARGARRRGRAHPHASATAARTSSAALRFLAAQGVDLIVTSGGLGPTADDLTAEVVGRFAGRELVLDEGMEAEDRRRSSRASRAGLRFDPEALRDREPKAGDGPGGLDDDRPRRAPPRGSSSRPTGWRRDRAARARRASCTRCGRTALETDARARGPRRARRRTASTRSGCSASRSPSSPRACARSRQEIDLSPLEITTCLRRAELVDRHPQPARRRGARASGSAASCVARHEPTSSASAARRSTSRSPSCSPGHRIGVARVVHGRPARGAPDGPARARRPTSPAASSPTRTRRRASCSASRRS